MISAQTLLVTPVVIAMTSAALASVPAALFLALGALTILKASRMVASGSEAQGFSQQRRGRLTIECLSYFVGVLWLLSAAT